MERPVKVACVQVQPVVFDREATLDKLETVAAEAAGEGAELVVFPETFVPVYPSSRWAKAFADWEADGAKETFARLAQESVAVGSPAERRIAAAAQALGIWIVTGVNEVEPERPGTIYNSLLYHSPAGELALHHRKLVPTNHERLVWGQGDGRGLEAGRTRLRPGRGPDRRGELHAARARRALRVGGRDLRRLDRRRRRRMAADARPHRAREPRVRRRTGALPARVGVPRRLPAGRRDRRSRHDRPRRQRDPRSGRLVPRRAAVRRGGDSLRGARPGAAACGAAALRPGRSLQPAGRAPAHSSRGRCDDEYTSFRAIFPSLSGKTSTPSHSFEPVDAVHSQTAKSSPARSDLVVKRSVGLLPKIPAMCSRTDAAPSARSSAV